MNFLLEYLKNIKLMKFYLNLVFVKKIFKI